MVAPGPADSRRIESSGQVARHVACAAARLFAARGYDATPVREIVEAAGVTKPTLYYHFGSKEGLAQALVTRPLTRLLESLLRAIREEPEPIRALERMLEEHFAFCVEDPDRSRFVYALFFGPLGSGLAAELCRFGERMDETWLEASRRLAGSGVIDAARVEDFVASLRGLIVVHTIDFLYRGRPLGPGLAPRLIDNLLHGFGRPGPPGR
jgi:AcrR family transcriptional regulator